MALEVNPLWLQDVDYAAREDRKAIQLFGSEGVIYASTGSLKVSQRAAGADYSVDVAVGMGVILGDNQTNQGSYLVHNITVTNKAVTAPPASNSRIDIVGIRVWDVQAGSVANGSILVDVTVTAGTAAASPVAPALPVSTLLLAYVTIAAGQPSIQNSNISDKRVLARPTIVQSVTQPTDAISGLIWLKPV